MIILCFIIAAVNSSCIKFFYRYRYLYRLLLWVLYIYRNQSYLHLDKHWWNFFLSLQINSPRWIWQTCLENWIHHGGLVWAMFFKKVLWVNYCSDYKLLPPINKPPVCKTMLTKISVKLCDDEIIWMVAMTPLPLLYNVRAVVAYLNVGQW